MKFISLINHDHSLLEPELLTVVRASSHRAAKKSTLPTTSISRLSRRDAVSSRVNDDVSEKARPGMIVPGRAGRGLFDRGLWTERVFNKTGDGA
jgi:hypothetical protein